MESVRILESLKGFVWLRIASPSREYSGGDAFSGQGVGLLLGEIGQLSLAELVRSFGRQFVAEMCRRRVSVVSMEDHGFGEIRTGGEGLGAKVSEHGVGAPTSQYLSGLGVYASAEESSGSPWPEPFHGKKVRGHTSDVLDGLGRNAEGPSRESVSDITPTSLSSVEVTVDGRVRTCLVADEMASYPR